MKADDQRKVLAYIRVSTDRQDVENQRYEILKKANSLGLGPVEFVEETISGRKSWQDRGIGVAVKALGEGDVLIVSEISRLGRSMLEIFEVLSILARQKVRIYSVKNDWELSGGIQSKVIAMAYSLAAEIEADLIRQRTTAALNTRKRKLETDGFFISKAGRRVTSLGRPKGPGKSKLDEHRTAIVHDLESGMKRYAVAGRYGTSTSNLWNWLKQNGLQDVGKNLTPKPVN